MLRIALTVVLLILSQAASSYPASGGASTWEALSWWGGSDMSVPNGACPGYSAASSAQGFTDCICALSSVAGPPASDRGGNTWWCTQNSTGLPSGFYQIVVGTTGGYTCPGGGTLSGSTCTCAVGETDSGSACVPAACPAGQALAGPAPGTCEAICPGAGREWNSLDSYGTGGEGLSYPSGQKSVCIEVAFSSAYGIRADKCEVIPTGSLIVCADYGGGAAVACNSQTARYTGARCNVETDAPVETATSCDVGDTWCRSNGSCASGFNSATFNGQSICVKAGEAVSVVPQEDSPLAPPDEDEEPFDAEEPEGAGESEESEERAVAGIGDDASSLNGSGEGGSGESDIEVCGLPDTPPCKIDETGTPTGEGADTDARAAVDTEQGKLTGKLTTILGGSEAPNAGWGFGISFPSTCNPFTVGTARWGFFSVDFCDFQAQAHDIMSLVWVASTLFLVIGMVFRTINVGG